MYKNAISLIDSLYTNFRIDDKTKKHSHKSEISSNFHGLDATLELPGYKFFETFRHDYLANISIYHLKNPISHSDIAIDIFNKCVIHPELIDDLAELICEIGKKCGGHSTAIPQKLSGVCFSPQSPNEISLYEQCIDIGKLIYKNRINDLGFNIPIEFYPFILFWVILQEDINYPTKFMGRRTPLKHYIEAMQSAIDYSQNHNNLAPIIKKLINNIVAGNKYDTPTDKNLKKCFDDISTSFDYNV